MTDFLSEGRNPDQGPASRAERSRRTHDLLEQAHTTSDEAARTRLLDEVIVLNRCVAEAVANRYRGRGVPMEDLHQSAYEGLVKAVHKFDPSVRPDLLTYAVPSIRGEVQRWFRDKSWMVRPPRRLQELQWRIGRSRASLTQQLGREPDDDELCDDLGCSRVELDDAVQAFGCFQPSSLDRTVGQDEAMTLGDLLVNEDEELSVVDERVVLSPALRELGDRDRRILFLRFYEDRSQKEIGAELGVTQMQVSRLLERILRTLRREVAQSPMISRRGTGLP
jgi:RNA polymerase sigma-B factor